MGAIRRFLVEHDIRAGYFSAWGGFSQLTLKYYQVSEHTYKERTLVTQVEVVSQLGNIARLDGEAMIHAHTTVGNEDFQTYSGHLGTGMVKPLLAVCLTPFPGELRRVRDEQRNLSLLDLGDRSEAP